MNALNTARSFMVLLLDESGPLDSFWSSGDLTTDAMIQLARTMWPQRDLTTVLTAEWGKPVVGIGREFHITIPGTHEVKVASRRERKKRQPVTDFDESELLGLATRPAHLSRYFGVEFTAAVPAPSVEPGPKCGCGIKHTLGSFRDLPLVTASDRTEGSTVLHDESRTCACGALLSVTMKRLLGDR